METVYEVKTGPHKGFLGTVHTQIILKNGNHLCEILHPFNGPTVLITSQRQFVYQAEVEEGEREKSRLYRIDMMLMEGTEQVLKYHTSERGWTFLRHGSEELQMFPEGPRLVVKRGDLGKWEYGNAWKDSETSIGLLGTITGHEQSNHEIGDQVAMFLALAAPILLGNVHSIETRNP